ncbi:lipoprotein [Mycoplasma putrefaciens]|uniref:Lipoprotein n=1 Tax=Mycoplasma putrefaciens (strain ATCC 15718 / NCTC 10155 / C30 KS-1 / KS-1) TaxID=743965 RepID=A0A7U3ZSF8_MYCPK|nr:lipoprotein [Mycoplasma putrefaciens]AEM68648.1 lipoprotein [Mycoplasma putrefaciens KS1]
MKKLLTFLGTLSLSAGGMLTVISCSSVQRFSDPSITDKLAEKVILDLKQNADFNFNNGDIFYKLNFKELITNKLNQLISEKKYEEISKDLSTTLNISEDKERNKSEQVLSNLATLKLFNEYTAKRSDKGNTDQVDLTYTKNFGLNPYELQKDKNGKDKNVYAIYYKVKEKEKEKWLRWQTTGEFTPENTESSKVDPFQIPDLSLLTDSEDNFKIGILQKPNDPNYISNTNSVMENGMSENNNAVVDWYKVNRVPFKTNGENIVKYRFAYYFKTEIQFKLFSNLLGSSYLDSNLYFSRIDNSSASDKKIILNATNRLISNVQTNFTQQNSSISNIKMVWAFSSSEPNEIFKDIQKFINSSGSINKQKTLKEIYKEIKKPNDSKQGNDPFLSMGGFNGFVQNDKDSIKSLSGDLKINDSAKKEIAKVTEPSILTNSGSGYESTIKGNKDFIFVLPIYLNDIFSTKNIQLSKMDGMKQKYKLNVLENTWTDMSQKYRFDDKYFDDDISVTKIEDSTSSVDIMHKNNKSYIKLKSGKKDADIRVTYNNKTIISVKLNKIEQKDYKTLDITQKLANNQKNKEFIEKNHKDSSISYDYNLKDYKSLKEKQNDAYDWNQSFKSSADILDLSTESKQALLDQLKSLTSSIEDVQNAAKTELYSQYLNADEIKYKELFDEISKFVRDDIPSLD